MAPSLTLATLLTATLLTITALPAVAADATEPETIHLKNPWLAAGLSSGVPLALGYASLPVVGAAGPIGFGAGHVYAGDPQRGLWVSIIGVGAMLSAGAIARYWPTTELRPRTALAAGVAFMSTGLIYSAVSGVDAYLTAERWNQQAIEKEEPLGSPSLPTE